MEHEHLLPLTVLCGAVISSKGPLPPLHIPSFGLDWFALAFALGLALPLLAYFRRWRPAPIVTAAMVAASLTWLAHLARLVWKPSTTLAYIRLGLLVSSQVLLPTGITALVRQNVPKERIAAWYTVLSASWTVLGSLYGTMLVALREQRSILMVGISVLLVAMTIGWIVLQRHRPAPSVNDESVLPDD